MEYIRPKEYQAKHDAGIVYWARKAITAGWSSVRTDLPGSPKPPLVNGYIPDIYATHSNQEYIIEVETSDSINSGHALLQKVAFQKWASAGPNRKFELRIV